jgi:surface protein
MFIEFDYFSHYLCRELDEYFRYVLTDDFMKKRESTYLKKIHGYITDWNTSKATKLGRATYAYCSTIFAEDFNENINDWDVSNVKDMGAFFYKLSLFNQPLHKWDTSNVEHMAGVFRHCSSFNQPLNNWNVSKATNIESMFMCCEQFNQPLDKWDVSKVEYIMHIFYNCAKFNQPINSWNLSKAMQKSEKDARSFRLPRPTYEELLHSMFIGASRIESKNKPELKTLS